MEKSALTIQAALAFLLLMGLLLCIDPGRVYRMKWEVLRFLHLKPRQAVPAPLSPSRTMGFRILGLVYVVGTLFVFSNMRFQCGRIQDHAPTIEAEPARGGAARSRLRQIIGELVEPHVKGHEQVGIVVAVVADGESVVTGFGHTDLNSGHVPDGTTLFEIGSISKLFTAVLLADKVREGSLSLDAPLTALFPSSLLAPDSHGSGITLKELVTHTSCLPRLPEGGMSAYRIWLAIIGGNAYEGVTEQMMLDTVSRAKPGCSPGEEFHYSNLDFGLLGMILSRRTGMDYDTMVRRGIVEPLGLKNTFVGRSGERSPRPTQGYRTCLGWGPFYMAQTAGNWYLPDCIAGAGGICSTGNDMLAFLSANMGITKTGLDASLSLSHEVLFSGDRIKIGMGWLHTALPESRESIIWHDGMTGGYSSFLGFTEDKRFGIVVLGNLSRSVYPLGSSILDYLVEHRVDRASANLEERRPVE